MRPISPALAALLEKNPAARSLVRFDLGEGTYGFWTGTGTLTHAGVDYVDSSIINVDDVELTSGAEAEGFSFQVVAEDESGMSPDTITSILSTDWKGRVVTMSTAFFQPETRDVVAVLTDLVGYIDTMTLNAGPSGSVITVTCEDERLDNARNGARFASHEDQLRVNPNDTAFRHSATARTEKIPFGRDAG